MLSELKGKVVQKLQAGAQHIKLLKELRSELDALIKAIGECKSKSEEDRIIAAEIDVLKQRLADPKLDKSRGREYMVRLIYCEMLGHDVSWAYVKAVQFASEANIHTKKASKGKGSSYLGLSLAELFCLFSFLSDAGEWRALHVAAGSLLGPHPILRLQQRIGFAVGQHVAQRPQERQLHQWCVSAVIALLVKGKPLSSSDHP
jgi:hypothetical protein